MQDERPDRTRCGRRSAYDSDIATAICRRLEEGETLRGVCSDPAMPHHSTVMRWLTANPDFQERYAAWREAKSGRIATRSYGGEIAGIICNRLAKGEGLRLICRDPAMPGRTTVFEWLRRYEEFRAQYAAARELQADHFIDEIIEIADSAGRDPAAIAEAKLRIDARKWVAAKLAPRKYGNAVPAGETEKSITLAVSPLDMGVL